MRALIVLSIFLTAFSAVAATWNVSSLEWTNVSTVLSNVAHGDTVILPRGTNVWTNGQSIYCAKGITLYGAGIDTTTIGVTNAATNQSAIIFPNTGTNKLDICYFTLDSSNCKVPYGMLAVGDSLNPLVGSNLNYRVHHMRFANCGSRGLVIFGWAQGVTFSSVFHSRTNDRPQPYTTYGPLRYGDERTNAALFLPVFGSISNMTYVEDCIWDMKYGGDGALDGYADARFVVRYNVFTNGSAPFSVHEYEGGRYATHWEFYKNLSVNTRTNDAGEFYDNNVTIISHLRGGVGVIWSNDIQSIGYVLAQPKPYLSYYAASGRNIFTSYYDDVPKVAVTGDRRWDGNTNVIAIGYPAMDQPGWGDPTTFTATNSSPTFYGCYSWSNRYTANFGANWTNVNFIVQDFGGNAGLTNAFGGPLPEPEDLIVENRDYFNDTQRPGYTPAAYPHIYRADAFVLLSSNPTKSRTSGKPGGTLPMVRTKGKVVVR